MFTKGMVNRFLSLAAFLLLVQHQELGFASADRNIPTPIVSVNVSNIVAGSSFRMRCEMPSRFVIGDGMLMMWFGYTFSRPNEFANGYLLSYSVRERKIGLNVPRERVYAPYIIDKYTPYIASSVPVNTTNVTSNIFDIIITTRSNRNFEAHFFCYAVYADLGSDQSQPVSVNVTAPFAAPTLFSSVATVSQNRPFTFACSLPGGFHPGSQQKYEVAFLNSRDGQMASYEVDAHGKVFLSSKESALKLFSVLPGARAAYPIFDLEVTEKAYRKLSYWCELRTVDSTTGKFNFILDSAPFKSAGLTVDFISTANATTGERQGWCSLDGLENIQNQEYQVLFYSDLGAYKVTENLLGYYSVKPHRVSQFVAETVQYWTSVAHGSSVEYPRFGIVAQLDHSLKPNSKTWWCALNYTEPGHSTPRLIKSNLKSIF